MVRGMMKAIRAARRAGGECADSPAGPTTLAEFARLAKKYRAPERGAVATFRRSARGASRALGVGRIVVERKNGVQLAAVTIHRTCTR